MGGGIFGRNSLGIADIEAPVCDTNSPDFNADMCYTGPFPGDGKGHPLKKKPPVTGGDDGGGGAQGPCPNGSYVDPVTGKCAAGGSGGGVTPVAKCPAGQTNIAGVCVPTGGGGAKTCPAGTVGIPPVCVSTGGGKGGGGGNPLVDTDIGQGTPKTDYTLPIVLGAGLLVLGVGAYFLFKEPTRARPNKKRKRARYSRNESRGEAGGWYKQEVGGRTLWFWAITPQKKANSFSGISIEESGHKRPKATKDSVVWWDLWTRVHPRDVPRHVEDVADEKLLELSFKKR